MLDKRDDLHTAPQTKIAARLVAAGVGTTKIVAGNYSALMACLNDILTHTVTIASDGARPDSSPIHLIVEPMWLDAVHPDYNNELWGQSIDAFPLAVQNFAKENIKPPPEAGHKLTWGQVRDLRNAMLEHIKSSDGFKVYTGQIQKVEEIEDEGKALKILLLSQDKLEEITIPFVNQPIVLDCSQRPRPAGPALAGDPTILYQHSRADNERLAKVPIFAAGAGAQTAWVLDKMGNQREYSIGYNRTLDFRIANAILGRQQFTATDGNVTINNNPELERALERYKDGGVYPITYTRDDHTTVEVNVSLHPNRKVKLIPAALLPIDLTEAQRLLKNLGVAEEHLDAVLTKINRQIKNNESLGLRANQLIIKLMTDPPTDPSVGFAVNATGWVALKDTVSSPATPFWGTRAKVTTGEELITQIELITPGSLLPGSGIPRMLAMKNRLLDMRSLTEDGIVYDVRALSFTGPEFERMCNECHFSPEFSIRLKNAIQRLSTPEEAVPNPVSWIIHEYETWLKNQPSKALSGVEDTIVPEVQQKLIENTIQLARTALINNVTQNEDAERLAIESQTQFKEELRRIKEDARTIMEHLPIANDDGTLGPRIELG